MRLTVVGCSGSYPGPESPASCYLVEADDETGRTWRIVLDMGSGSLGALQRHTDPLAIDAVFLSHLHADHCLDLTGYYVLRRYHPSGPQPRIPVWGPVGTAARMARAYDLPPEPGMNGEFDFRVYDDPAIEVGPFSVQPVAVDHPVPAFGLRVTAGGRTLGYSGDTGDCPGLHAVAEHADLFLAEASFVSGADNPTGLHLTGAECGDAARRGHARRLVVTHVPPWHDPQEALTAARASYDGEVVLATAGAVYEV
jgi:ribonuclease BN (tRNA processing enzyme)